MPKVKIFRLHDIRRVMPDLMAREDASLTRTVANLDHDSEVALSLLVQKLNELMEREAEYALTQ